MSKIRFVPIIILFFLFLLSSKNFYINNDDYWTIFNHLNYPVPQIFGGWVPGRIIENFFGNLIFKFFYVTISSLPFIDLDFFSVFSIISGVSFALIVFLSAQILNNLGFLQEKKKNNFEFLIYVILFLSFFSSNSFNITIAYGLNNLIIFFFILKIIPPNILNNEKIKDLPRDKLPIYIILPYLSAYTNEYSVAFLIFYIFFIFIIYYFYEKNFNFLTNKRLLAISLFFIFSFLHFYLSINSGRFNAFTETADKAFVVDNRFFEFIFIFFKDFFIFKIKFYFIIIFFSPFLIILLFILSKKINNKILFQLKKFSLLVLSIFFIYIFFLSILNYSQFNAFLPLKMLIIIFYLYCLKILLKKNFILDLYFSFLCLFFFATFLFQILNINIEKSHQYFLIKDNWKLMVNSCKNNKNYVIYTSSAISKEINGKGSIGYLDLPTKFSNPNYSAVINKTLYKFYNCSFKEGPVFTNNKM